MPRQWQENRPVKAKVHDQWRLIKDYERLPNKAIRVPIGEKWLVIPAARWAELTEAELERLTEPQSAAERSPAAGDPPGRRRATPKRRMRLTPDRVPREHVAIAFIGLGALILVAMIMAALMTRF